MNHSPSTLDQGRAGPAGSVAHLVDFVTRSIGRAAEANAPFLHLRLADFFPDDVYAAMLAALPNTADYRAMSGRSRSAMLPDGTPTRVKMDLFPEYIRHLPADRRAIWRLVGRALCSREIQGAFVDRLAPDLARRFGADLRRLRCYAVPILTRDVAGYSISPHTDTRWKAITVQICLPPNDAIQHVGTVFHERLEHGELRRATQVAFAPNGGYAFAVGDRTWHSADLVGPEVATRDSILLTYFADRGPLLMLRNRGKRMGNFLLNELRHLARRRRGHAAPLRRRRREAG